MTRRISPTAHVCRQLVDARERADLTQAIIARRAMWGSAQVSSIESGRNSPSVATIARYIAALGLDELTITIRAEKRP